MAHSPETQPSLLIRIRDRDDQRAWREFVDLYAPLLHAYGRHRGLQDADAADLAQQVLQSVAGAAARFEYDPTKGTFRGWLLTITRNHLRRMLVRRNRQVAGSGDTGVQAELHQFAGEADDQAYWDREYRWRLIHWAADCVRGEFRDATWQAFFQTAIEGAEVSETSKRLGITVAAVYIAKSRVTARIRQIIETVEPE